MKYALSEPGSTLELTAPTSISRPVFDQRATGPVATTYSSTYKPSFPSNFSPRSRVEQYWAARALSAETLLSAKTEHLVEVKNLTYTGDVRRAKEIAELTRAHNERLARLEKLIIVLLGFIAVFFGTILIAYLDASSSSLRSTSNRHSWAHFTIPILSPFASVVEQEVSVIGTRTIIAGLLMLACLAYAMFRYWLAKRTQPG
ncbi:hypothetical protein K435DRAFT_700415 [Dendrothele bispora CBS 962.96]|uniref:Uncharacterized protein n=1 Tax=Dendrothele bispora (strain CBS 962.96) TaxID=1314807 RepID=A0A4S8KSB0_DENBC|nr:hypothetical protein K435DRAFT_700415 [Dendrothele bispora CBS 962.96]